MKRRAFILGALAAPVVVRTPGLLMPVEPVSKHVPKFHCTSSVMVYWINRTDVFADGWPRLDLRAQAIQSFGPSTIRTLW